ncbi:SusC/RagA family TonB-linked outer membrane protein [Mucilaginibacter agri]|uniref:SusC/RagA family TonB-linked outer membrane protein n=1 Tax=Mucilaginibacter agri TaxID=2695265 RepID=A0A965ZMG8_9SPHI|nr:SusC/RagA family TonB-linked outer membrane protein [Mucilaginibacter agri]NCD72302.1 SusC/RagA family TonB-linked outer membrane protein [Mucilaginibacter agri]
MCAKSLLSVSIFFLCCLFSVSVFAQNRTVTGKISDRKNGSALDGVSVSVKGTTIGVITKADGSFKLSVPPNANTLVVTYLGYGREEVDITGKTNVNVSLASTSSNLNEVVVIGYGTQRIKDATGSVASLGTKNFNKGVITTPEQLLQGRVSGVQVTPASGEPGAGVTINIRGASSIRSNNTPLYVVDGVPLDNGGTSGGIDAGAGMSSARNPLSFLNPADIENISVLKDASATAIYGSRGANGVILITTKKGTKGQGFQLAVSTSVANPAKTYDLLNAADFVTYATKAGGTASVINKGGDTDWQDVIFRTGISQSYNLGYGNAGKSTIYRFNFGYDNQQGIVENSGLKRLTGRLNASQNLFKDKVRIDLNFTASNVKNQYAPITDNAGFEGSLIGAALLANPTYPIKNADGSWYNNSDANFRNPANMLEYINDRDNIDRYLTNIAGTWKIVKGLSYKLNFGYDNSSSKRQTYMDSRLIGYTGSQSIRNSPSIPAVTGDGRGIVQNQKLRSTTLEHTLTYDTKVGDHSFNVLGGYAYQVFKNYQFNDIWDSQIDKNKFPTSLADFAKHSVPYVYGDSSKYELQSFFGRVNYNYKEKYYATFTMRADGSSKFGENNKYGYFPAGALKWRISNESFAPKKVFDDLSLRLNYGQTGNQDGLAPYSSIVVWQAQLNGTNSQINAASPSLKWETTTSYGAGLDFAIVGSKLSGSVDYFHRSTADLLFLQDYPAPSVSAQRWVNLPGKVVNKGFDMSLNLQAIQHKNFTWEVLYNATFLKNSVEDFGGRVIPTGTVNGQGLSGAYAQTIRGGYALGSFYLPTFTGFDANGISQYANQGLSSIVGNSIPKFSTGLTNNFTMGKFNASIFLNAATGFVIYNNTANAYFLKGSLKNGRNVTYDAATSTENPLNSGSVSTRFLEKGDFLRLSNVSVGYTFSAANWKTIRSLRLSLTGQNIFLISSYSGLDPEVNTDHSLNGIPSRGIDFTAYPNARTFTLGLNAGF